MRIPSPEEILPKLFYEIRYKAMTVISDYCIVETTGHLHMIFDLYIVFRQIILNVKRGLLFTPTHCTKQKKHSTLSG